MYECVYSSTRSRLVYEYCIEYIACVVVSVSQYTFCVLKSVRVVFSTAVPVYTVHNIFVYTQYGSTVAR